MIYAGDTGDKWGHLDAVLLAKLGVNVDSHGKMPDVVLFYPETELAAARRVSHQSRSCRWRKRHAELARLFSAGLVYVTAFPSRAIMSRYLGEIAWETEGMGCRSTSHLIHFNGERFLGPYSEELEASKSRDRAS